MDRRSFLGQSASSGAFVAALVGAGRLPLLAAERRRRTATERPRRGPLRAPAPAEPAVEPITGHLRKFQPAHGALPGEAPGIYTLTYDVIHWTSKNPGNGITRNTPIGKLRVSRRTTEGAVQYEIAQTTDYSGAENVLEARILCGADVLDTLRSWTCRTASKPTIPAGGAPSELEEAGKVENGKIMSRGRTLAAAERPVVCQWSLLDVVARRPPKKAPIEFDLFQDLSLHKANQNLRPEGTLEVALQGGREVSFDSYLQTGEGVLPTHYLVDSQGLPQLVTMGMLSWALASVS